MSSELVLPALSPDANKYTRGKLVVVAGSARYPGAAVLAARASQRMGAGYTEVVTDVRALDVVRLSSPSLVVRAFDEWSSDELSGVQEGKPRAACLGPGFIGAGDAEHELVAGVLDRAACAVLVDGGGLSHLCAGRAREALAARAARQDCTVLTPHGGEAARLAAAFGIRQKAPDERAGELARLLGCVVVLKGPDTFIADGEGVFAMREGTCALAKAGTGDVLAGMTAALLAQGLDPRDAALAGTTLHARAGVLAAQRYTERGVVAEDLIEFLPAALRERQR